MSLTSPFRIDLRTAVALSLWAAVGGVALVLSGRAMAGAFDEPVGLAIPLLATLITLCGSLTAWSLFRRDRGRDEASRRMLAGLLSVVPAGVTGFAAATPAGPITLAVIAGMLVSGLTFVIAREGLTDWTSLAGGSALGGAAPSALDSASNFNEFAESPSPVESSEPQSQQHFTRQRLPDGSEQIEAVLLAHFARGQRETAVHLPIQPVLRTTPDVEAEPLDDGDVTVQPTAVHGYGVRLTVKRPGPADEAVETAVGVLVIAQAARRSAA